MRPAQRMDSLRRNVADRCWEAVPSRLWRRRRARALFSVTMMLLCISGCTSSYRLPWLPFSWNDRDTHRHNADDESYAIVQEKADGTPWGLPQALSIQPDPRSRLFDASDPSDPALPEPGPHLHEYELPPLTPRPDRFSKLDVVPRNLIRQSFRCRLRRLRPRPLRRMAIQQCPTGTEPQSVD
jgi:hypothetical protein